MTEQNSPAESSTAVAVSAQDDNKTIAERREKLAEIRQRGVVSPNDFHPTHHTGDLQAKYRELEQVALEAEPVQVAIAGRAMLKRVMGKTSFATVQDSTDRIQFYISYDAVGEDVYASSKKQDLGDIMAARGTLIKTKTDKPSAVVMELRLLSKGPRPLPDDCYGLADQEQKYRQRYVDLIISKETRGIFHAHTRIMALLRNFMVGNGFMEVETPMLHSIPGSVAAKPFVVHHNALDMQMFLRIAPELCLRRLIVGGFECVYEINYNFRNEDVLPRHNPEFTMTEFYAAYTDYRWLMDFAEQLIRQMAIDMSGTATLTYQGHGLGLAKPFHHSIIYQAIQKYAPQCTDAQLIDADFLCAELKKFEVDTSVPRFLNTGMGTPRLVLLEKTIESQLWEPTFAVDCPVEVSPLARGSDMLPDIAERFELFIIGREITSGLSELSDPEDQAGRFHKQVEQKDASDKEAMFYDADYIRILEYGMPPTGSYDIGIDRPVILLTDSPNIRNVIFSPHLRRED